MAPLYQMGLSSNAGMHSLYQSKVPCPSAPAVSFLHSTYHSRSLNPYLLTYLLSAPYQKVSATGAGILSVLLLIRGPQLCYISNARHIAVEWTMSTLSKALVHVLQMYYLTTE